MTLTIGLTLMLLASFLAAIGHLCFKKVARIDTVFSKKLIHPLFLLGGVLFACSPLIASLVAKVMDFSVMYAMTALTFVFIIILSRFVLHEKLDAPKSIGACIIVIGLAVMIAA